MPAYSVTESARGGSMTLGELFEETICIELKNEEGEG